MSGLPAAGPVIVAARLSLVDICPVGHDPVSDVRDRFSAFRKQPYVHDTYVCQSQDAGHSWLPIDAQVRS